MPAAWEPVHSRIRRALSVACWAARSAPLIRWAEVAEAEPELVVHLRRRLERRRRLP